MNTKLAGLGLFAVFLLAAAYFVTQPSQSMPNASLTAQELAPRSGVVKRAIILLHGSDGSSADMMVIAPTLRDALPDTQFLAPNGPFPSQNSRYHWFLGAQHGSQALNRYIEEVKAHYKLRDQDIALTGFSAGGMIALYTGLRRSTSLGAIVAFSASLVGGDVPYGKRTPVCMIYGDKDERYAMFTQSIQSLRRSGVAVQNYPRPGLGHEIDVQGITFAIQCLQKSFGIR